MLYIWYRYNLWQAKSTWINSHSLTKRAKHLPPQLRPPPPPPLLSSSSQSKMKMNFFFSVFISLEKVQKKKNGKRITEYNFQINDERRNVRTAATRSTNNDWNQRVFFSFHFILFYSSFPFLWLRYFFLFRWNQMKWAGIIWIEDWKLRKVFFSI